MNLPPRSWRRDSRVALATLMLLWLGFAALLPWDLRAIASWEEARRSWQRLWQFLAAFAAPDWSPGTLAEIAGRLGETAAVALLSMLLGTMLAAPLAVLASRAWDGASPPARGAWRRWGRRELARGLLDVLRGVPDFVWVLLLVGCTGFGAWTGVLGLSMSIAGSLGRVSSELWDNLPVGRYGAVSATGARRLAAFCYGVLPLSARAIASFWLLRLECTVRNASVIGVVGGGGLGASLWEAFKDSRYDQVATALIALLLLTGAADVLGNLLRRQLQLRSGSGHGIAGGVLWRSVRWRCLLLTTALVMVGLSVWQLAPDWHRLVAALQSMAPEYPFLLVRRLLLAPDLSAVPVALQEAVVPLSIALLGTAAAAAIAVVLVFPASVQFQCLAHRFTGAPAGIAKRIAGGVSVVLVRSLALIWRAVPEVAWVLILGAFWRLGLVAAVLAVTLHSAGVLLRIYVEAIDDLPPQQLEAVGSAGARQAFLYGAMPRCWDNWRTHAMLQFEGNLRLGIVLGMVGAGGLGEAFDGNLRFDRLERAGTFLWTMVLLSALVDRTSRWLQVRRLRC